MNLHPTPERSAFEVLRGFSRRRKPEERCELCGLAVGADHPHVLQLADSQVLCACDPCAILFSHRAGPQDSGRPLVRIPKQARRLDPFHISDAEWAALRLPIDLAFFVNRSQAGRVIAYYPSPAGNTESLLSLDSWEAILQQNPALNNMQPDIEALLVDRTRSNRRHFIAPIDQCYKLTGLIRRHWHGFSGGDPVWREVEGFFEHLRETARA